MQEGKFQEQENNTLPTHLTHGTIRKTLKNKESRKGAEIEVSKELNIRGYVITRESGNNKHRLDVRQTVFPVHIFWPTSLYQTLFNRSGRFLFKFLFFLFRSWEAWLGMAGQGRTWHCQSRAHPNQTASVQAKLFTCHYHLITCSRDFQGRQRMGAPGCAEMCVCMQLFMGGAFVYASWTYARQITRLTGANDWRTDLNSQEPQKEKSLNAEYHSLNKS